MNEARLHAQFGKTLSDMERNVLMLRYCDELTDEEIGITLDLPASLVTHTLTNLQQRASRLRGAASVQESTNG